MLAHSVTSLTVLISEDGAMIGLFLTEMLEDTGYNVCAIATTEEDAVTRATDASRV